MQKGSAGLRSQFKKAECPDPEPAVATGPRTVSAQREEWSWCYARQAAMPGVVLMVINSPSN
jgi:hypothetical protein